MKVQTLVEGDAEGPLLVLDDALSLWGGVDVATARIIEEAHPQHGETLTGKIVVLPHGRGSSSSSSVLAEMLRLGIGPRAIVLGEPDPILVIGALVAHALYDVECPIVVVDTKPSCAGLWRIRGGALLPVD